MYPEYGNPAVIPAVRHPADVPGMHTRWCTRYTHSADVPGEDSSPRDVPGEDS